jgi:hypothetical protein
MADWLQIPERTHKEESLNHLWNRMMIDTTHEINTFEEIGLTDPLNIDSSLAKLIEKE